MLDRTMLQALTRRQLLAQAGLGLGGIALGSLMNEGAAHGATLESPLAAKTPHFEPRAKNVIMVHLVGAPSHLDLFENKPELRRLHGELVPQELIEGKRFAFLQGHPRLMGSPFNFSRHGSSGIEISEVLPNLATVADELCVIKTLHTEEFNHAPAQLFFQTGFGRFGRPSLGSWVTYGLGSANDDLPAFVVFVSGRVAGAGSALWGSGFLPTVYQGVEFRTSGDPVLFLSNPGGISSSDRRRIVDSIQRLNQAQLGEVGDPEIATRIAQYEMACRMQLSVPELMDITAEPAEVRELYGAQPGKTSFANNCLLARRLVERGVRFVELFDADWDHHGGIATNLPRKCKDVDQPLAALIKDLKARGLLESTLVVWGAEFGRTPMLQGAAEGKASPGRDHHKDAYAIWMAGGGLKRGFVYGKTDDLGYYPVEDAMHVNDLHATLLHLLGVDHKRLTFKFQGRPFRLTDVAGVVAEKIIA